MAKIWEKAADRAESAASVAVGLAQGAIPELPNWAVTPLRGTDVASAEQPLPSDLALYAGRVIDGKYRLLSHLGSGGMGTVFSAEHVALKKRCALKFLRADSASYVGAVRRFEREAQLLARLEHENIVGLADIGAEANGRPYLVLEFIRGRTLRAEFGDRQGSTDRPSAEQLLGIVTQVARGLTAAHEAGVVHRDLKPENIMLTEHADGRLLVKILDFGVARWRGGGTETLTVTGQTLGTASYMSPEQARGESEVDARTDVHALAVIVYEGLSGVLPYEGSSYNETLFRILNLEHTPITQHRPDLPPALDQVLKRGLAKHATDRFSSPWELVSALRDVLCAPGVGGGDAAFATLVSAPRSGRLGSGFDETGTLPDRTSSSEPPRRKRWPLVMTSWTVGLVFGGLAVWFGAANSATKDATLEVEPAAVPGPVRPAETPQLASGQVVAPPAAVTPLRPDAISPTGSTETDSRAETASRDLARLRPLRSAKAPQVSGSAATTPVTTTPGTATPALPRLGGDYSASPYATSGNAPAKGADAATAVSGGRK